MTFPDDSPAPDAIRRILTAAGERPFVVAQLGQSLDGRIAAPNGESRWINGPVALDHLHAIRAAVDAIVVGVGTVVADDPQLNVRRFALPNGRPQPARVVLDPRGRVPATAKCLDPATGGPALVLHGPGVRPAGDAEGEVLALAAPGAGSSPVAFDPGDVVAALHRRGYRRILIEGGARTVSSFIEAGAVDRLHLLVAPVILGAGVSGLAFDSVSCLADARRPAAEVSVLAGGDVLFDCDLRGETPRR